MSSYKYSQVGKVFYNIDVKIEVISQVEQSDFAHVIFNLEFKNEQYKTAMSQASFASMTNSSRIPSNLPIKSEIFFELFPFHVVFNRNMDIISIGNGLHTALHNIEGESFRDSFNLIRPLITFTWDDV
jgi:guanylate cyclase